MIRRGGVIFWGGLGKFEKCFLVLGSGGVSSGREELVGIGFRA